MIGVRIGQPKGLPGPLPAGEHLLWQGAPRFGSLARRAFHVRKLAVYCGVLLVWRMASDLMGGAPLAGIAWTVAWILPLALSAIGLPTLLAWLFSRSTIYTITTRRIVIRYGVALPMTLNVPFRIVEAAALRTFADGTGDIPLVLSGPGRISYLHLWPNARPWRVARPEPMLRSVPEPGKVADILARALAAETGAAAAARSVVGSAAASVGAAGAQPLAA